MESDKLVCRPIPILLLVALAGAWSCSDDGPSGNDLPTSPVIYHADSLALGDTLVTESGLVYIELEAGSGRRASPGRLVAVHYTGMLEDGTVFDSSYPRGKAYTFVLGQGAVIQGWEEGIALMSKGARGRLIIPSDLGYGAQGAGGVIPPNATILFDIWLADVD